MSCKCARYDGEDGRWQCSITGDGCMYPIPNQKACSEQYGEIQNDDEDELICPECGNDEIYYENPMTGNGKYNCDYCGFAGNEEEFKGGNKELAKMQRRAKRLILSDYYDSVHLSDVQYSILKQLTNAKTNKDINSYLWNTGCIEKTLDYISAQIKLLRKGR